MIPDGTSPEAIVIVVVVTTLIGCALMAGLFWYRFPNNQIVKGLWRVMSRQPARPKPDGADRQAPQAGINPAIPVSVSVSDTDTAKFDLAAVPADLTYEEVVAILAGQMTPAGKPAYSGKKIYNLVGGNYNEFTAFMRQLRPKDGEPAEPPPSYTPIVGRPTRATFREQDPDLVYEPPGG